MKNKPGIFLFTLFLLALLTPSTRAEFRNWTSATGSTVEAKILTKTETNVRLQLKDGRVICIGLDQISKADRDFANDFNKATAQVVETPKTEETGYPDYLTNDNEKATYDGLTLSQKQAISTGFPKYNTEDEYSTWTINKENVKARIYQKWEDRLLLQTENGEKFEVKKSALEKVDLIKFETTFVRETVTPRENEEEIVVIDETLIKQTKSPTKVEDEKVSVTIFTNKIFRDKDFAINFLSNMKSPHEIVAVNYYGDPSLWKNYSEKRNGSGRNIKKKPDRIGWRVDCDYTAGETYTNSKDFHWNPIISRNLPLTLPATFSISVILKK